MDEAEKAKNDAVTKFGTESKEAKEAQDKLDAAIKLFNEKSGAVTKAREELSKANEAVV